jgi:hypothetical protein
VSLNDFEMNRRLHERWERCGAIQLQEIREKKDSNQGMRTSRIPSLLEWKSMAQTSRNRVLANQQKALMSRIAFHLEMTATVVD